MRKLFIGLLFIFLFASAARADNAQLFAQIQNALQAKDETAYLRLMSNNPALQQEEKNFVEDLLAFSYQRALFQLTDETEKQILIEVFFESTDEARFESWAITTVLEGGQTLIAGRKTVSSLGGLYRLRLSTDAITVKNLDVKHFDATFHLKNGKIFLLKAAGQVAGLVFVGDSSFEFSPSNATEKQQLTLFCKQSKLVTSIPSFYVRTSTSNLKNLFGKILQTQPSADPDSYQRARQIAEEGNLAAFNVNIPMTNELWFPMVQQDSFFSQLKSQYGTLLYQYSASERDNVMLVRKEKEQIISLYNVNGAKVYGEEQEYKILDYRMRVNYQPRNDYFTGTAEMQLESAVPTTTVLFKLNPLLRVTKIRSSQGPLIYFQENQTKSIHLVLNEPLGPGDQITLIFNYQGALEPELSRTEAQSARSNLRNEQQELYVPPSYLYSNQSLWYPQPSFKAYMHAVINVTVPSGYMAVSNGQLTGRQERQGQQTFTFDSGAPVRYFSLMIARFGGFMTFNSIVPIQIYYDTLDKKTAEEYARETDKILRFYSEYFGEYPYKSLSLVLRPLKEPGGHAPATVVIVNRVYTFWQLRFKRDPLYQPEFPALLLAHEIAHQWWGQAVGWDDYKDQWLSEGFAQFAAWEYIRAASGVRGWSKLANTFSDWIEEKTSAGPLILGARLGHLNEDPRAFSAILYHKGAYILNMLKNWIGPEAFRQSLREFYKTFQFQFADVNAFEGIIQKHSTQSMSNFFHQWLYTWGIPSVTWSDKTEKKDSQLILRLRFSQAEKNFYLLRVPVEARAKDGKYFRATVDLQKPQQEVELRVPFQPDTVSIDPLHENLMKSEKH